MFSATAAIVRLRSSALDSRRGQDASYVANAIAPAARIKAIVAVAHDTSRWRKRPSARFQSARALAGADHHGRSPLPALIAADLDLLVVSLYPASERESPPAACTTYSAVVVRFTRSYSLLRHRAVVISRTPQAMAHVIEVYAEPLPGENSVRKRVDDPVSAVVI
jgi:hypothetical protein